MRFSKEMVEANGHDWKIASERNAELDALASQRVAVLPVAEEHIRSKIAWKYAGLRHSITYRLVDLAEASIDQWQQGHLLACVVLARAFFETVAVTHWLSVTLRKAIDAGNIDKIDEVAMQVTFGGRLPDFQIGGAKAVSVLTALDKLSEDVPHARDFYERISEIAHPNSQGMHLFYASLDQERVEVTFSRDKRGRSRIADHLLTVLMGVPWSINALQQIDGMIAEIAELQSRNAA